MEKFRKHFHPELPGARRNTIFPSHVFGVSGAASVNIRSAKVLKERDLTAIHFDRDLKKWRRDTAEDPKPRWFAIKLHSAKDSQSRPTATPLQLYPDPFAVIFTHQDWKNRYAEMKLPTRADLKLPIALPFKDWDPALKTKYCLSHLDRKKANKSKKSKSSGTSSEEISTETDSDKSATTGEKDWICGQTDAASDLEATASDAFPKPIEKKRKGMKGRPPKHSTKAPSLPPDTSDEKDSSTREKKTSEEKEILTSETRKAWGELLGIKSTVGRDLQKEIYDEALEATKRLITLLSTGHPERESIRKAQ